MRTTWWRRSISLVRSEFLHSEYFRRDVHSCYRFCFIVNFYWTNPSNLPNQYSCWAMHKMLFIHPWTDWWLLCEPGSAQTEFQLKGKIWHCCRGINEPYLDPKGIRNCWCSIKRMLRGYFSLGPAFREEPKSITHKLCVVIAT